MIDWLYYQQYHFGNACSQGRSLSFTAGMEFPDMKFSFLFSGKVVSV